MKRRDPRIFLCLLALTLSQPAFAELRFARIFSDNAVLQREKRVPVWGWAAPNEKVTVTFAGQTVSGKSDATGKWTVWLAPMKAASNPQELTVAGTSEKRTLKNILVGEVWITGGQSNMDRIFQIDIQSGYDRKDALDNADQPLIRYIKPAPFAAFEPMDDFDPHRHCAMDWRVYGPDTIKASSSLPFYFAWDLQKRLGVPVGLVQLAISGTPGMAWTRRDYLVENFKSDYDRAVRRFEEEDMKKAGYASREDWLADEKAWRAKVAEALAKKDPRPPVNDWPGHHGKKFARILHYPGGLYNAMVSPTAPYAARGVIWHQGEGGPYEIYSRLLQLLAKQWRVAHQDDSLTFIWGTLAAVPPKEPPAEPGYGDKGLRNVIEHQIIANNLVTNAAGINFVDLGNGDVHWAAKDVAGRRMAAAAQALCYGEKDLVYNGPLFESCVVEADKVRIRFKHSGSGLEFKGPHDPKRCFSIAGADRVFHWADAKIEGRELVVWSDKVSRPDIVLYAMTDKPALCLYNEEGLPAFPFRTKDVLQRVAQPKPKTETPR